MVQGSRFLFGFNVRHNPGRIEHRTPNPNIEPNMNTN